MEQRYAKWANPRKRKCVKLYNRLFKCFKKEAEEINLREIDG
jgi:hypothetical protein